MKSIDAYKDALLWNLKEGNLCYASFDAPVVEYTYLIFSAIHWHVKPNEL